MKTLEDFTPEIQAKIPEYQSRVLDPIYDGSKYKDFRLENAIEAVNHNYTICEYDVPLVFAVENPFEAQIMFNFMKDNYDNYVKDIEALLKNRDIEKEKALCERVKEDIRTSNFDTKGMQYHYDYLFTLNIYSQVYYIWYEFIRKEFNLELTINDLFQKTFKLHDASCIYSAMFSEQVCIVSKYPYEIHQDEENEFALHNVDKRAVSWGYEFAEFDCYYVNGREVPKEYVEKEFTFEDFLAQDNEDLKAAMITIIKERSGNEGLLKFLNAELVDEKEVRHNEEYSETLKLYKTKEKYDFLQDRNGNMGQPYCWSEMVCPSTGSVYLIENSADFTCALEAAKFLRPTFVPQELTYTWEHSAN